MVAFFEQTWLLWWMAALVVILLWFHAVSERDAREDPVLERCDNKS